MTTSRPLRKDAERNRVLILDAAREAFAERGLDVSMDEIARRAGVGVATVYRRFPDRELLVEALFEERLDDLVAIATEAAAYEDAWEGLAFLLERFIEIQAGDRGLRELMLTSAHAEERVERARAHIDPIGDDLVARAQADGSLRGDAVAADLGLIQFMLVSLADFTRDVEPAIWKRLLAIVLDGLRASGGKLPVEPLDDEQWAEVLRTPRL